MLKEHLEQFVLQSLAEGLSDQEKTNRKLRSGIAMQAWKVIEREAERLCSQKKDDASVSLLKKTKLKSGGYRIRASIDGVASVSEFDALERKIPTALRRTGIADAVCSVKKNGKSSLVVVVTIPAASLNERGIKEEREGDAPHPAEARARLHAWAQKHDGCDCPCCSDVLNIIRDMP